MKGKGYTLIEVLIVVAIIGILAVLSAPNFRTLIQNQRLKEAGHTLYHYFKLARSDALYKKRGASAVLQTGTQWCVGLNNGTHCHCNTSANCSFDGEEVVLKGSDIGGDIRLIATGFTLSSGGNRYVRFEPIQGRANSAGTATLSNGKDSIQVRVNVSGRLSVCSDDFSGYAPC